MELFCTTRVEMACRPKKSETHLTGPMREINTTSMLNIADHTLLKRGVKTLYRAALLLALATGMATSAEAQNGYTTPADVNGNGVYDFQEVTNLTISCPSNIAVNNDAGTCGAAVTVPQPTALGFCGSYIIENDFNNTDDASGTYPVGATTVNWIAVDERQDTARCSMTVTVTDNEKPTITCPTAVSATTNSGCTATGVSLGTPSTADNCRQREPHDQLPGRRGRHHQQRLHRHRRGPRYSGDHFDNCGVATVTNDAPGTFPIGVTVVTWTATDNSGNTATCTQNVTVTDNVNPTISCPAAVAATTNSGCTATGVALGTPVSGDNCGVANVTNDAPAAFPIGRDHRDLDRDRQQRQHRYLHPERDGDRQREPGTISCPAAVAVATNSGCTASGVASVHR
jgi:hypothetical protein